MRNSTVIVGGSSTMEGWLAGILEWSRGVVYLYNKYAKANLTKYYYINDKNAVLQIICRPNICAAYFLTV